jgi:hypothetical protein
LGPRERDAVTHDACFCCLAEAAKEALSRRAPWALDRSQIKRRLPDEVAKLADVAEYGMGFFDRLRVGLLQMICCREGHTADRRRR